MLEKALEKFVPIDEDAISTFKADVYATVPLHENLDPIKNKPRDILPNDKFHFSIEGEELKPGTLRIFNVHASDLYSWTGLRLVKGGKYKFTISPEQKWKSLNNVCGPDGWPNEDSSPFERKLFRLTDGKRR